MRTPGLITPSTGTGSTSAKKAMAEAPLAIIIDMMMQKITGDVLARSLLRIRADLPILLLTGFDYDAGLVALTAFAARVEEAGLSLHLLPAARPLSEAQDARETRALLEETLTKMRGE